MMKNTGLISVMGLMLALGCNHSNEVAQLPEPSVSLTFSNLPHLAAGQGHYQLWARFLIFNKVANINSPQHDSIAVSIGEFNVTEDGHGLVSPDGGPVFLSIPSDQNLQLIDDVFLTIQNEDELARTHHDDPGPAFLGGKVVGNASVGVADLDITYAAFGLGTTFSDLIGKYTITAPSSPADSNSGVWFIEKGATTVAGLQSLPTLPDKWRYEGWVGMAPDVGDPIRYYSTGRFLKANAADADSAGPGRGTSAGLNFPGQDFIVGYPGGPGATPDLRFYTFMVTVEPEPDNSPEPFFLRLLSTGVPTTPLPHDQTLSMNNVGSSSFPHVKVTIVRDGY